MHFCVVCYQDDFLSYTQPFRFSDAERYEEIRKDPTNPLKLGLQIDGITNYGHKATLEAIKKVIPKGVSTKVPGTYLKNVHVVAYSQFCI